jgi:hypothetical protein
MGRDIGSLQKLNLVKSVRVGVYNDSVLISTSILIEDRGGFTEF